MEMEHTANLLQQYIARVVDLEGRILETLEGISDIVEDHAEVASAVNGLRLVAQSQQKALQERLRQLDGIEPGTARSMTHKRGSGSMKEGTPLSASEALQTLYSRLNEAAFGYAVLHLVAHRFFDSNGEGNTADLAEKHLGSYAQATQSIGGLTSDVVIWELGKARQECQCKCPSCGLGVCLCSPHGANTAKDAWREAFRAITGSGSHGIRVRPVRAKSAADRAGLQSGDIIIAVDDQAIQNEGWDSMNTQQAAIRKHQSGEIVRFRVQRVTSDLEIPVTRP